MSTKSSIKWKDYTDAGPGYHLYEDVMDQYVQQYENDETPVYLRLDGVQAELRTVPDGVSVTVMLPRAIARELGLIS